jgi:uncharacterized protein YicC (UPF0701 family)
MAKSSKAKKGRGGGQNTAARTRSQSAVVRRYLEALQRHRPKRGRKRTPESIKKRLQDIERRLQEANPLQQLQLVQERMDLQNELDSLQAKSDLSGLEDDFVKVAKEYGEQKGITYGAWRQLGVNPDVLRRAGVPRTRRTAARSS